MAARPLVDPHGRTVRDLRISITDRCNFRCEYCMPEEGMVWQAREDLLTFEEIERIARICVERYGFTGIRLTGGEPTVRAHLPVLVAKLAALGTDLAMTTNGASLGLLAHELHRVGARLMVRVDAFLEEHGAELDRLGLPMEACRHLVEDLVAHWIDQPDALLPDVTDQALERFPVAVRGLFRPEVPAV